MGVPWYQGELPLTEMLGSGPNLRLAHAGRLEYSMQFFRIKKLLAHAAGGARMEQRYCATDRSRPERGAVSLFVEADEIRLI